MELKKQINMKKVLLFLFLVLAFSCTNKFLGGKGGKGGQGESNGTKGKDGQNGKNGGIYIQKSK